MENHVPVLETCNKLQAEKSPQGQSILRYTKNGMVFNVRALSTGFRICDAPILTDILAQLPIIDDCNGHLSLTKVQIDAHPGYVTGYVYNGPSKKNPAEAAALLWLKLKEDNAG